MKVHIVDNSGDRRTYDVEHVQEGDHGLYLMEQAGSTAEYAVGQVPYSQLDFVEPAGGSREAGGSGGRGIPGR